MADLLTTLQVQDLLKVDRTTIYRMIDSGHLPAFRVGKQWRFKEPDIQRWLVARSALAFPDAEASETQTANGSPGSSSVQPGVPVDLNGLLPRAAAQLIQDAFAETLGITIVTTDMQGFPITEISNACGFHAALLNDPDALNKCAVVWRQLAASPSIDPRLYPNEMGLLCARGLIRVGSALKGMVVVGGIAPDAWPPSHERLAAIAELFGLSPVLVESNAEAVYRLDRPAQERVLRAVQRVADIFSHLADDRIALSDRMRRIASLTAF